MNHVAEKTKTKAKAKIKVKKNQRYLGTLLG